MGSVCELLLCVFVVVVVRGGGGVPSLDLFNEVTFLGEAKSSPAVLRLEKEASVPNLQLWGGDCEM